MRRGQLPALVAMIVAVVLAWFVTLELAWALRVYTGLLLVLLPVLAIAQVPLAQDEIASVPRLSLYLSSAVVLWGLAMGALGTALISGIAPEELGLVSPGTAPLFGWTLAALVAALGLAGLGHALGIRESALLRHILPRTARERAGFLVLALSAGVCEELVFRGFLIPVLIQGTGSIALAVLLATAVFGTLHAYQGALGATRAALLGLLLTVPFLMTGSVVPSMLAHFAYDVVAGVWLGPWLVRR